MSSLPYICLFSCTLILGSILALSGNHWIFIWMGLELNLMSFIPLLTSSHVNQEAEAAMKYFMAQALGSGLLLLGALSLLSAPHLPLMPLFYNFLLIIGLLIKLGLPPCHFWFPAVMSSISWPMCLVLTTWQKIIPIILLSYTITSSMNALFFIVIIFSSFIGGLGGLNQTQLRPLLAYSSIGHMSWIIAASMVSYTSSMIYFLIYILISIPLMSLFWNNFLYLNSSLNSLTLPTKIFNLLLVILILSLAGVPPFTGFFPKWLIIQSLCSVSMTLVMIILIGSMINLYYYLNLMFISILKTNLPPSLYLAPTSSSSITLPMLATSILALGPMLFLLI
uniref:NADH-ubiquinone oxidoreductase chain 2 n=1 Tax=Eunoe nodosa TaxID=862926 RepID=A0A8B6QMG4_9ANNE|nr:NADH dehydrogenase subunit 2 [Eunoe nodosa]QTJ29907.1 NADH dehydrogenase subunit 2 [Eunoe nodosa]